jgi:transcriptional regulator with XRE-family HTH domain
MAIHIGKKIKEEFYKQGHSVSQFARKINRSRNVVYDIFERESIDTALLNKIGILLRTDFFSLYSEQKEYKKEGIAPPSVEEYKAAYTTSKEKLELKEKEIESLRDEITHLKKLVALMEEKDKKGKRK